MTKLINEPIEKLIFYVRGHKVILDSDLARIYDVETKKLNQAVKRNLLRFPPDFMFQLAENEWEILRRQIGILKTGIDPRGGRQYLPFVFTEQGVAMLSSVLKSDIAVLVNIEIMRTFVKIREFLLSNQDLARKLADLEKKYDTQFKVVFDAIRELMTPPKLPRKKIGIIED